MPTATLTRIGNSIGVAIPRELRGPGFRQGDKVNMERRDGGIVITPVDEPPTFRTLMRGYDGPPPEFIDPGASFGNEAW